MINEFNEFDLQKRMKGSSWSSWCRIFKVSGSSTEGDLEKYEMKKSDIIKKENERDKNA